MGEHKGALKVLILFIAFIAPGLFMFGLDSLHQHAFMKVTAEVGELVKEEGGVTEKVANTVNELQKEVIPFRLKTAMAVAFLKLSILGKPSYLIILTNIRMYL